MDKQIITSKGSVMFTLVIVILLLVGILPFLYFSGNLDKNIISKIPLVTKTPTQAIVGEANITIENQSFIPGTLTVKQGTQVTWTNKTAVLHRIVSDPHPTHDGLTGLDSEEPLAQNESFSFTFEKKGTYTYHSETDPINIKGTVIVK